jgi:hypothetical protein
VRFVGVVSDVTERKEAAADQALREATMALAVDAGNVGTWDYDPRTRQAALVRARLRHVRHPPGADVGLDDFYAAMHPDDREATRAGPAGGRWTRRSRRHRRRIPHDRPRRRGGALDLGQGPGLLRRGGRPARVVGATVDITERKRAELHLRLLVNELNHRVKNSLATIQAIAAQTFHAARSLPQAQEAFSARIVALAEAHDLLTRENWEGADLEDLLNGWRPCTAAPHGITGASSSDGTAGAAVAAHGPVAVDGPARAGHQRGQVRGAVDPERPGADRLDGDARSPIPAWP